MFAPRRREHGPRLFYRLAGMGWVLWLAGLMAFVLLFHFGLSASVNLIMGSRPRAKAAPLVNQVRDSGHKFDPAPPDSIARRPLVRVPSTRDREQPVAFPEELRRPTPLDLNHDRERPVRPKPSGPATTRKPSQRVAPREDTSKAAAAVVSGADTYFDPSPCRVFVFTMDSLADREVERLTQGGPGGEAFFRKRIQTALEKFGCTIDVMTSDAEMERVGSQADTQRKYTFFLFDEWTLISPSLNIRPFLEGVYDRVRVMSYFGVPSAAFVDAGISLKQVITPFPAPHNSYLGFPLVNRHVAAGAKRRYGLLWGKTMRYLSGHDDLLKRISQRVELHATVAQVPADDPLFVRTGVVNRGLLAHDEWERELTQASFLLGLRDPVMGPSALEAIAHGATYINPRVNQNIAGVAVKSQHPYAEERIGEPYTCTCDLDNWDEVESCLDKALARGGFSLADKDAAQDESVAEEELSFVHEEMLQPQFEQRVADVFRSKER